MSALEKINWVSQDEYLQHYANDPNQRWELIDGQVFAQVGASRKHNKIAINLATAFKDRTKKLWDYAKIDSVQEYATLEQDRKMVTLYRRRNEWTSESFSAGVVVFESIGLTMTVDEIYHQVFG